MGPQKGPVLAGVGEVSVGRGEGLRRRLDDVRRTQVAVFERSSPAPVSSVAAPVRDGLGQTLAAVSVVVPAGSARPQAYVPVVRATALAVARGLGHRPPRSG